MIVIEFLDFARPQKVQLERGNVNDIIKKALVFISPKVAEQNIEIKELLDPELQYIQLDQEMLYRAILNILVNALQAMGEGGTLRVESRPGKGGSGVEFQISDTGAGISEKKIEHIFNPFFTDKNKGTGLGLAITKNIIDSHNGEIWVSSQEGQGTSFFISLP